MNEDKQELIAWIKERMRQKEGDPSACFCQVIREDPLLLKDIFQTFSGSQIIDAILDETQTEQDHLGIWVRRRGDLTATYTEVYPDCRADEKNAEEESPYSYS
ncbi:MAG: hypothetical protein GX478_09195 [Erysipelotrichaceae bacterium]|nr:hypothetical protein [Erysipelotrichaceae bacterium]